MNDFGFESLSEVLFAGIPNDRLGEIHMLPLGMWLLLIVFFVLFVCLRVEKSGMNNYMVWIRQGSYKQMWNRVVGSIYLEVILVLAVLFAGVFAFDGIKGNWKPELIILMLFYVIHILFVAAMALLFFACGKPAYIVFIVIAEACTYILSVQTNWRLAIGMYCYWNNGIMWIINMGLKLFAIWTMWRKDDLFGKETLWKK